MLTGPRAVALAALLPLAGCLGPGGDRADAVDPMCLLGGPPREPPPHREAFNLTDEHLERFPVLASLFAGPAQLVKVRCAEAMDLLRALQAEGADVLFLDQPTGHHVYLTYEGATLHVGLSASV